MATLRRIKFHDRASFFSILLLALHALFVSAPGHAEDRIEVVETDIDRSNVKFKRIDTENVELTLVAGVLAIEDFDTGELFGARAAYHLNERLFFEASYFISEGDRTSFEELFPGGIDIFGGDSSAREYKSWDVSGGINLFPGETWFFGRALSSDVYLMLGAGRTDFGGDEWTTLNVGIGYRLFLTDWIAWRIDIRDHIFTRNIVNEDDRTNNIETSMGFSVFF